MIKGDTGCNIDILVLDICNMNSIEILYELGKKKVSTVKNILTYINSGPLEGMPYEKLIDIVQKNNTSDTDILLKNMIDNIQLDLLGIKLDPARLKSIKNIVSNLAYIYLTDEQYKGTDIYDLLNNNKSVIYNHYLKLNNEISTMVTHYRNRFANFNNLINLTNLNTHRVFNDKYLFAYYKLSFAKNNYWTYVLGNKSINDTFDFTVSTDLIPSRLQLRGLMNLIRAMNPTFNEEEVRKVLKNLYEYKKWGQL